MINTQNESSLHAQLKEWYKLPGDKLEKEVGGSIIDLVRDDHLIEIQTANFGALRKKLRKLLDLHKITLVFPVFQKKWILQLDAEQQQLSRRRSPRKGKPIDIFSELVSLPQLITHPNFSLEILLCEIEEIRVDDGQGSYRRKGKSIKDRRLLQVNDRIHFANAVQMMSMFLADMEGPFTSRDLAKTYRINRRNAQKMAYSFRKMGAIRQIGKKGNLHLYARLKTDLAEHDHYHRLLDRLPSQPLVIGKDNYYHSVVLVPFVEIADEQYLLFQKRSDKIKQPGEICFPGGGVERFKDKDIEATAVRETREELGVSRDKIEVGGYLGAIINPLGAFVDVFAGKLHIKGLSDLVLNKKEVEEAFLVPVNFFQENDPEEYRLDYKLHSVVHNEEGDELELFPARKLGLPAKYWRTWGGKHRRIFVYKFKENIIWGLTAEIVRAVINLIRLEGV